MKTDRIFVLLLVVMLPLSGCFDDAVGDAEGADDTTSGSTVINHYNNTTVINHHYHNNTTTNTNVVQNTAEVMSIIGPSTNPAAQGAIPGVLISTSAGQVVEVLQIFTNYSESGTEPFYLYANDVVLIEVECESLHNRVFNYPGFLPTDGGECTYWFYLNPSTSASMLNNDAGINVIYRMHN